MPKSSRSSTGSHKPFLGSVESFIRKNWQIWAVILSLLLSLGIVQIPIFKVEIKPEVFGYLILSMLLAGSLFEVVFLTIRNNNLKSELANAQKEMSILETRVFPSFFLEDIALSALMAHIELRKEIRRINPVKLDMLRIDCRVVGPDVRKDADTTYYLKGTNISDHTLTGLNLAISGENLVPFSSLGLKFYNLNSIGGNRIPLKPKLLGPDSIRKDIFLPFVNPGIEPYGTFEIELKYLWPRIFNPAKDYWFLDNLDYEGATRQIVMKMEFIDMHVDEVRLYSFNSSTQMPYFLGVLPSDPENQHQFVFEKTNPEKETYYILLFEVS